MVPVLIWDYDGTIADTREKNLEVTREIISVITGKNANEFHALLSLENYVEANRRATNWREFYRIQFGMKESQIDEAGRLWSSHQLQNQTPVSVFDDVPEILDSLNNYSHGIFSQNSRAEIEQNLNQEGLLHYFDCIIGYEEVGLANQKPDPTGLLMCVQRLVSQSPATVAYIGDHPVDVLCVQQGNQRLQAMNMGIEVVSVVFCHEQHDRYDWKIMPDNSAKNSAELLGILRALESKRR